MGCSEFLRSVWYPDFFMFSFYFTLFPDGEDSITLTATAIAAGAPTAQCLGVQQRNCFRYRFLLPIKVVVFFLHWWFGRRICWQYCNFLSQLCCHIMKCLKPITVAITTFIFILGFFLVFLSLDFHPYVLVVCFLKTAAQTYGRSLTCHIFTWAR